MTHEVFSIVAPVAGPGAAAALRQRINPAGDARQPIPGLPLDRLPMLHYASLVVFDGQDVREEPGRIGRWLGRSGRTFTTGPRLVFECCIDGPRDAFLDALLHIGGPALHEIFSHCVGYPGRAGAGAGAGPGRRRLAACGPGSSRTSGGRICCTSAIPGCGRRTSARGMRCARRLTITSIGWCGCGARSIRRWRSSISCGTR